MIKEIDSFDKYTEFINDVASDPCFSDPHYTYDKAILVNSLQNKYQKAFVSLKDNTVNGLFVWDITTEENYIEMLIGLSRDRDAYSEMLTYIEAQYQNYKMDFVLNPQNMILCNLLKTKNARFDAEQQNMRWVKDVNYTTDCQIQLLSQEFEKQYLSLHNKDTYWTGEKVLKANHIFRVLLAIKDHQVIGYLDITHGREENEIYDLYVKKEFANEGYEQDLLAEAIHLKKPNGLMVVVDVDAKELAFYTALGFEKLEGQNSVYATYRS